VKLVMTLVCRDAEDVLDAQIAFHLSAGVDFVIATDHRSVDGTTDILERYERQGYLHLIREDSEEFEQAAWVTRMARLAATDFAADWVINSDADEFWWPRGPDLKQVLSSIPSRYGLVRAIWRTFPPRPDDTQHFAERMTVRVSPVAPINDPTTPWRPNAKLIHRADPAVTVRIGNHAVENTTLQPLRGWFPVEILHFPWRSYAQCSQKASLFRSSGFYHGHRLVHDAQAAGLIAEHYDSLVVDDDALERGLAEGALVRDARLRDALRTLAGSSVVPGSAHSDRFALPSEAPPLVFRTPSVVDDVAYAIDAAVFGEAEIVRAQRRLDDLEQRIASLERRPWSRLVRKLRRAVGPDRAT
jgi:hypothetical protein